MHIKPTKVHCLLGLKYITMYERVKPATKGPVADTYLELKMLSSLFYFVLESDKISHNIAIAVVPEKTILFFPLIILSFFFISIPIPQFINIIAPNNDLLMDKYNVIYFAPKW